MLHFSWMCINKVQCFIGAQDLNESNQAVFPSRIPVAENKRYFLFIARQNSIIPIVIFVTNWNGCPDTRNTIGFHGGNQSKYIVGNKCERKISSPHNFIVIWLRLFVFFVALRFVFRCVCFSFSWASVSFSHSFHALHNVRYSLRIFLISRTIYYM